MRSAGEGGILSFSNASFREPSGKTHSYNLSPGLYIKDVGDDGAFVILGRIVSTEDGNLRLERTGRAPIDEKGELFFGDVIDPALLAELLAKKRIELCRKIEDGGRTEWEPVRSDEELFAESRDALDEALKQMEAERDPRIGRARKLEQEAKRLGDEIADQEYILLQSMEQTVFNRFDRTLVGWWRWSTGEYADLSDIHAKIKDEAFAPQKAEIEKLRRRKATYERSAEMILRGESIAFLSEAQDDPLLMQLAAEEALAANATEAQHAAVPLSVARRMIAKGRDEEALASIVAVLQMAAMGGGGESALRLADGSASLTAQINGILARDANALDAPMVASSTGLFDPKVLEAIDRYNSAVFVQNEKSKGLFGFTPGKAITKQAIWAEAGRLKNLEARNPELARIADQARALYGDVARRLGREQTKQMALGFARGVLDVLLDPSTLVMVLSGAGAGYAGRGIIAKLAQAGITGHKAAAIALTMEGALFHVLNSAGTRLLAPGSKPPWGGAALAHSIGMIGWLRIVSGVYGKATSATILRLAKTQPALAKALGAVGSFSTEAVGFASFDLGVEAAHSAIEGKQIPMSSEIVMRKFIESIQMLLAFRAMRCVEGSRRLQIKADKLAAAFRRIVKIDLAAEAPKARKEIIEAIRLHHDYLQAKEVELKDLLARKEIDAEGFKTGMDAIRLEKERIARLAAAIAPDEAKRTGKGMTLRQAFANPLFWKLGAVSTDLGKLINKKSANEEKIVVNLPAYSEEIKVDWILTTPDASNWRLENHRVVKDLRMKFGQAQLKRRLAALAWLYDSNPARTAELLRWVGPGPNDIKPEEFSDFLKHVEIMLRYGRSLTVGTYLGKDSKLMSQKRHHVVGALKEIKDRALHTRLMARRGVVVRAGQTLPLKGATKMFKEGGILRPIVEDLRNRAWGRHRNRILVEMTTKLDETGLTPEKLKELRASPKKMAWAVAQQVAELTDWEINARAMKLTPKEIETAKEKFQKAFELELDGFLKEVEFDDIAESRDANGNGNGQTRESKSMTSATGFDYKPTWREDINIFFQIPKQLAYVAFNRTANDRTLSRVRMDVLGKTVSKTDPATGKEITAWDVNPDAVDVWKKVVEATKVDLVIWFRASRNGKSKNYSIFPQDGRYEPGKDDPNQKPLKREPIEFKGLTVPGIQEKSIRIPKGIHDALQVAQEFKALEQNIDAALAALEAPGGGGITLGQKQAIVEHHRRILEIAGELAILADQQISGAGAASPPAANAFQRLMTMSRVPMPTRVSAVSLIKHLSNARRLFEPLMDLSAKSLKTMKVTAQDAEDIGLGTFKEQYIASTLAMVSFNLDPAKPADAAILLKLQGQHEKIIRDNVLPAVRKLGQEKNPAVKDEAAEAITKITGDLGYLLGQGFGAADYALGLEVALE